MSENILEGGQMFIFLLSCLYLCPLPHWIRLNVKNKLSETGIMLVLQCAFTEILKIVHMAFMEDYISLKCHVFHEVFLEDLH